MVRGGTGHKKAPEPRTHLCRQEAEARASSWSTICSSDEKLGYAAVTTPRVSQA